eukprot:489596-Prorocentrum_lima.AAC.1
MSTFLLRYCSSACLFLLRIRRICCSSFYKEGATNARKQNLRTGGPGQQPIATGDTDTLTDAHRP